MICPSSLEELQAFVREASRLFISSDSGGLEVGFLGQGLEIHAEDQVAVVPAGMAMDDLQAALNARGQCLPCHSAGGTVGGRFMANRESEFNWRDWILGATFVLADGRVAKSGSHAVKSVAGYDVHRFMAGTRGSLAICTQLILRTHPYRAEAPPVFQDRPARLLAPVEDPVQVRLMRRAKEIFDPTGKFNPGEWGFM